MSRLWQTEDGLPQNSVQAIIQTRDGYLWVGTQNGLARFDGVHFTVFDDHTVPEIKRPHITALCESKDGTLWIGTEGGGVTLLKGGVFSHVSQADGLAGDVIRSLYASRDGSIWISTTKGLTRYRQGKFENVTEKSRTAQGIVRGFCEDANGNLWMATTVGVNGFKEDAVVEHWTTASGLRGDSATAVLSDSKSNLWVGVVGGLSCLKDGEVTSYTKKTGLADNRVTVLYEDREGTIWVGTYGGLNRLVDGQLIAEMNSEGQPYDWVNAILQDREGNLWIGAKDGLSRLRPRQFTSYTAREGLTHNNVVSVYEDKQGTVWIGTWGGGPHQLKNGVIKPFRSWHRIENYPHKIELVLGMHEDHLGQFWIGTDFAGGLFRLNEGEFHRYNQSDGLSDVAVRVVYEDSKQNLWVGTSKGLFRWKDAKFLPFGEKEGMAGGVIRVILEDKNKVLWVGTEAGLNSLRDGRFSNLNPTNGLLGNLVYALHEDGEGSLWIGTHGGLNRLKEGKLTAYTTAQGLFNDDVFEILEDAFGYLWMSCRMGVFSVRKSDLERIDRGEASTISCQSYGKGDGLVSVECNSVAKPAGCRTRDGRLWFPTAKGLVVVDPKNNMHRTELPPPVVIETVIADRNRLETSAKLPHSGKVSVPPGSGELEFHYTALSFAAPEKNRFKYKLEGVDTDWKDVGSRRVAYYNNIKPGDYHFRVMACNNDGVWSQADAILQLSLEPHYWQTWWFRLSVIVITLSLVTTGALTITKRRMQLRLQRLEQQQAIERERARIAQDMHDDLGARLTEILLLNTATKKSTTLEDAKTGIGKVSNVAREVIDSLDALVWTVNPKNDSLPRLSSYICEYAGAFLKIASIPCRFELSGDLPNIPISSEVRHNVLLVVKEALNNVVKYSATTEVWLRLQLRDSTLRIAIEDNGKGFSIADAGSQGNGLSNMQRRIESIHGCFQIVSEPGKGTRLLIEIPIRK
ncbi:MAG: Two component regulator, sensor protein [Verrucomicrobiales bacterium]|nr:Two component regulator, sensor protein [Verrucomicrobiales bacterium]